MDVPTGVSFALQTVSEAMRGILEAEKKTTSGVVTGAGFIDYSGY